MRLIRRIPKRGFNQGHKKVYTLVQVSSLDQFEINVTPAKLKASGLAKGKHAIKILGSGELEKKLIVQAHAFSQSAERKITEAGGVCQVVGL